MKYSIVDLTKQKNPLRRGRVIMPKIEERRSTVKQYQAALYQMLRGLADETKNGIVPAYRVDKMTRDVDENTFNRIRDLGVALSRTATQTVERILQLESIRHTETFIDQAKQVIGIDISSIVQQTDIADYMRNANARNASLIKSLSDDMVKRVEQAVIQNQIAGNSVKTLRKQLTDEFGIGRRRADLIAADQSAKLTADLNQYRQQQAGINGYQWSTSADERVRPRHRAIDGTEYQWGEYTGAEGGLPPGQPIRCRCTARAILDFDASTAKKKATLPPVASTSATTLPTPAAIAAARAVVKKPPIDTDALDADARQAVVSAGKKDRKEHLVAYDAALGLPVEKYTSGKASSVGITPALQQAMTTRGARIVVHHNHPSSNSFSDADLVLLHKYDIGLERIWAHGHNGSSFAAKRGKKQMKSFDFKIAQKGVQDKVQKAVNDRVMNVDDANAVFFHMVSMVLARREFIEYYAELAAGTKEAFDRNRDLIERIVQEVAP